MSFRKLILRGLSNDRFYAWWFRQGHATAAIVAAIVTATWHRRWLIAGEGTPQRGLFDGLCHAGTALAVSLPVLPYVRDRAGFLRTALVTALVIDLDHVFAARSLRLEPCMTMEHRPPSHSLLAPLLVALVTERAKPKRHLGLGVLLGLGSHLLRDLGTGGAPIVHPRRIVEIPFGLVVVLLTALTLSSRQATRLALGAEATTVALSRRGRTEHWRQL